MILLLTIGSSVRHAMAGIMSRADQMTRMSVTNALTECSLFSNLNNLLTVCGVCPDLVW